MSTAKLVGRNIVIETAAGARIDISIHEANQLADQLVDAIDEARRTGQCCVRLE